MLVVCQKSSKINHHKKSLVKMTAVKEKNWLSDFDLHLFGEGKHYSIYEKLGAHLTEREGQS